MAVIDLPGETWETLGRHFGARTTFIPPRVRAAIEQLLAEIKAVHGETDGVQLSWAERQLGRGEDRHP